VRIAIHLFCLFGTNKTNIVRLMSFREFSERLGRFFETNGLPRTAGRVLAHLLTCDPAEQTFDEIVTASGASRSTVSVATRFLMQQELVERFGIPGERRDRYRLRDDAWTALLKQDVSAASQLRGLAADGLRLARPARAANARSPAVRARLQSMHEFFVFLEEAYAPLLVRWEKRRTQHSPRRGRS
jgi:DNA-binding MarR family transcriptional regulator